MFIIGRFRFALIVTLLLLWWLLRRPKPEEIQPPSHPEIVVPRDEEEESITAETLELDEKSTIKEVIEVEEAPAPQEPHAAPRRDDLTRIEGIGPKISGALQAAGIDTYAQLAEMDVTQIREILSEAGIRSARPDTWPEQARLAASND